MGKSLWLPIFIEKLTFTGEYVYFTKTVTIFAKSTPARNNRDRVNLEVDDFNFNKIEESFEPVFIDPGRNLVITSAQRTNDIHTLPTKEFYDMANTPESNIPIAKASHDVESYHYHRHYMHKNYACFFRFYDMSSTKIRMKNFVSKQKALDESVNILTNGGK
ncbi:hypothetical protein MFLAVUS_010504 [Mucor flavus]|uniref:Uncharacterized protein n=1 Tax=Mucor flavus TaxID=439312 RepID=A0ABP9ZD36_9FUNG